MKRFLFIVAVVGVIACGGSQKGGGDDVGDSHANGPDDLDVEGKDPGTGPEGDPGADGGSEAVEPAGEAAAYTIVVKNTHSEDLAFNMDAGWAGNIAMFSGKPPKAVSILPFPRHCTAGCDADAADICPSCPQPEKLKDIRKAQKLETVPAGKTIEIPWDGQVHVYEKVKGKKRCECFARQPAVASTYTVRVCGLRITKSAEASTVLQCIDGEMTVPSDEPQRLELEFPKPPDKKKR
jgi:hypothetical protein